MPDTVRDTTEDPRVAPLAEAIRTGDRGALARAITLVESARPQDRLAADQLLQTLLPHTGNALRVGITGVPGVGKSTLIDQLGTNLTEMGHKVAVLAVDPTSQRTGGAILGDKTRMHRLARNPQAFVRPSPSSGALGGVARRTRESMALCEAAGFDVVLVETVGVGQSETEVANMVDCFVVLLLPGGGDELQGIKKGLIEMADIIAINKADGDNMARAEAAAREYRAALSLLAPTRSGWTVPVLTLSGKTNQGLDTLWETIEAHRAALTASGEWDKKRAEQAVSWMQALLRERLMAALMATPGLKETLAKLEGQVRDGTLTPPLAVDKILAQTGLAVNDP